MKKRIGAILVGMFVSMFLLNVDAVTVRADGEGIDYSASWGINGSFYRNHSL